MVSYYKVRQLFYYKVRQVLQSATIITKCDSTVLSLVLKESKVSKYLIKSGSLFQSLGNTHAKDLSP